VDDLGESAWCLADIEVSGTKTEVGDRKKNWYQ
jgi:hypothetical protein